MAGRLDLEGLKRLLQDDKTWISVGKITQVEPSPDFSVYRCMVLIFDDNEEIVARTGFPLTGPDSGLTAPPVVGDMVLVCFSEADEDAAFIFCRLTSKEDRIPFRTLLLSHMVLKALSGQALSLGSDTRVNIGRGGILEESEPLVLGNVLLDALGDMIGRLDTLMTDIATGPVGIGNMGYDVPTHPALIAKITATKAQLTADVLQYLSIPVTNIVSMIAYTER